METNPHKTKFLIQVKESTSLKNNNLNNLNKIHKNCKEKGNSFSKWRREM